MGSVTDGLADTRDTVEGDDGVRVLTVGDTSVSTGEGVGTEAGRDKVDGVGVTDEERDVGKDGVGVESSEIGDTNETLDPEVVGRRNDVSNEMSRPSGIAAD